MVDLKAIRPADLWYTIGLITTDGNLSNDGRHINITSKDLTLLYQVKKALLLKNKVGLKARGKEKIKKYGFLQFGDVVFYRYLLTIGLTPRKSLTLQKVDVPQIFFLDFLRGIIDGDGNIHRWIHPQNGGEQWEMRIFTASPQFALWLYKNIAEKFRVKGIIAKSHSRPLANTVYVLKFGKMAAKAILGKCYYENSLALERKRLLAQQCLKSYVGWTRSLTVQ